ncbi:FecCD family ABC transporter permease [Alteromonas profundi]|nr:iron ABC transporter permease [Alteromonas profundi]
MTQACTRLSQYVATRQQNNRRGLWLFSVALAISMYLSVTNGSIEINAWQLIFAHIEGLYNQAFGVTQQITANTELSNATQWYVFAQLRLPRVIMTSLIGALLATAGCTMQGLVRNPLADPGLIGISGGAAAAAAVSMAVMPASAFSFIPPAMASIWVGIWAFLGALAAVLLVLKFSNSAHGVSVAALILAGVAINAFTGTIIGAVSYVASDDALRQISYWTMGSLAGANWNKALIVAITCALAFAGLFSMRNALNLLALGEGEAAYMGLDVKRYKKRMLWLVTFCVALATALCGIIGFVGLVVPHICRTIFGVNHRILLPASALVGALLLSAADTLSRSLFSPMEIPIGIVTSAIGAPFFLYLLWQQKGVFSGGQ